MVVKKIDRYEAHKKQQELALKIVSIAMTTGLVFSGVPIAEFIPDARQEQVVRAADKESDGFTYTDDGTSVTITGYTRDGGQVNIPTEIDGMPVTAIGARAFQGSPATSIEIPASVTTIGIYAFDMAALTSIEIPANVVEIGAYAFAGTFNLEMVTFSETSKLTTVGQAAFWESALTSIEIPANVTDLGTYAFYEAANLETVKFSENSKLGTIKSGTFQKSTLSSIEIPASVTTIELGAFAWASNLAAVTFSENGKLAMIDDYAFIETALTSIEIPASVTTIGLEVFRDASKLMNVTFSTASKLATIGGNAFESTALTNLAIPLKTTMGGVIWEKDNVTIASNDTGIGAISRMQKAQPGVQPIAADRTGDTIKLNPVADMDYGIQATSDDLITWQTDVEMSNVFTNLEPGTSYNFYLRTSSDEVSCASVPSEPAVISTKPIPDDIPWPTELEATYGDKLNKITDFDNGFEWQNGSDSVGDAGLQKHNLVYTPEDTETYGSVTRAVDVRVMQATFEDMINWPTGLKATYGDELSTVFLAEPNHFAWENDTVKVGSAGKQTHTLVYTPADPNYKTVTNGIDIEVNKANPTDFNWPVSFTATYGDKLSDIDLGDEGQFSWLDDTVSVGNVGQHGHTLIYTPEDDTNYNSMTSDIMVNVNKADPTGILWPTALDSTYGNVLGDVELPDSFSWDDSDETSVGNTGENIFGVWFTPEDDNFNSLFGQATVNVGKANQTIPAEVPSQADFDGMVGTTETSITLPIFLNQAVEYQVDGEPSVDTWYVPGTVIPNVKPGSEHTVVVRVPGDDNHNPSASWSYTVTTAKTAVKLNIGNAPSLTFGTGSYDLAKLIDGVSNVYADAVDLSTVEIKVDGNPQRTLNLNKVGTYNVQYSYGDVRVMRVFVIKQAIPTNIMWPQNLTGTTGQTLNDVPLPNVAGGKFTWKQASTTKLGQPGNHQFEVIFTPNDKNYMAVNGQVTIKVTEVPAVAAKIVHKMQARVANKHVVQSKSFKVAVTHNGSKNITDAHKQVTFKSSNKRILTINKQGIAKAKRAGKVTITVRSQHDQKQRKVTIQVHPLVKTMKIVAKYPELHAGHGRHETIALTTKVNKNAINKVSWKVSNKRIARITKNGQVIGKKAGWVTITAKAKDGSNKTAKLRVYMLAPKK
ncbi:hypothetical protein EQG49_00955 [Periweissella cryptocerci]|uniref:BIG2 domain-containing protein n=1 Tax=Periweissella cryptocerci TaxID=2506420 RepID=A0A4P6YR98_9LACO|nr:leucine-rich repeat protein [Periweissella cryptocerci]QBO35123.1 hypothetical protein EQG49_00955 [Periweissella cryptocerci]